MGNYVLQYHGNPGQDVVDHIIWENNVLQHHGNPGQDVVDHIIWENNVLQHHGNPGRVWWIISSGRILFYSTTVTRVRLRWIISSGRIMYFLSKTPPNTLVSKCIIKNGHS